MQVEITRQTCPAPSDDRFRAAGLALAQQREFYDTRTGKSIGRSTTDTSGTTTFDDAGGRGVGIVTTQQKGEQRR